MVRMDEATRAHLATLARAASSVALGPVGVAATVSDECRAYLTLAEDRAALETLEPELVRLTREGAPGAIVYAALLLRRLGRDVAPLLEPYRDDRRACSVFPGGCMSTTHWLSEAVHWVLTGQPWSHPERLLEYELQTLAGANWLELPSQKLLAHTREGRRRDGRMASGNWVFTFTELFLDRAKLQRARPALERLLAHQVPHVRLYAALLIRELDRDAGESALAAQALSGVTVYQLKPSWGGLSTRTTQVPIREVVTALERWPDR
jgi:hypothetical protein